MHATFGPRAWASNDEPVSYSLQYGIDHDRTHIRTLGPKGRVPQEFLDSGKLKAGQSFIVRTGVVWEAQSREVLLVVGANAQKSARVNGLRYASQSDSYQWITPVQLLRGINPIELSFTAERDGTIRASWCMAERKDESLMQRPERIVSGDRCRPGSELIYRANCLVPDNGFRGSVMVSSVASAVVYFDSRKLGQQGGFDPYRAQMRGQIYALDAVPEGTHELSVTLTELQSSSPLRVDLLLESKQGRQIKLVSSAAWTVQRDGEMANPVQVYSRQEEGSVAWLLYRRPHPLPETQWLEEDKQSPVIKLQLIPPLTMADQQEFEWIVPPGAVAMQLRLEPNSEPTLFVDGQQSPIDAAGHVLFEFSSLRPARAAKLRVLSRQLGGGVFLGPITYQFGQNGLLKTGNWIEQGLGSYSGAVRLSQRFSMPNAIKRLTLDLGQVRGSVQAFVNGSSAGIRVLSPYTFDLTNLLRTGENELELVVTNTLANFLSTWSPTTWWSPDQLNCGIFGPACLNFY